MGRPTLLDARTERALVRMVRTGNRLVDACATAGITYTTMKVWMKKGAAGIEPYRAFRTKVMKAKREAKTSLVTAVVTGGLKDPKVGIAILERRYPDEWGRKQRVTLAGDASAPVNVAVLSADEARRLLAERVASSKT